jgi:putative hemolysin
VTFLEASLTVSRALKVVSDAPHSRYPVVGQGQDDVLGFVHIRDLLLDGRRHRGRTVGDAAREIKRLPGSKNVLAALSEMRREGYHLAIVADEYGGTDGIVTLEDLIEEVIGEIRDEYDVASAGPSRLRGGVVEVDGRLNLDEFAEITDLQLPEGPYETAAGYVMAALGRLPAVGDSVQYDGYEITVTEVDGRRAARVRVTPPKA